MKIHVHLGAHKTATTFIQRALAGRRISLADGVSAMPPIEQVRAEFTDLFDIANFAGPVTRALLRPTLRKRFGQLVGGCDNLPVFILSDENLAGTLDVNYRRSGFYPQIGHRVRYLEQVMQDTSAHYFFAVRNYTDYLSSAFLQLAGRDSKVDYHDFFTRFQVDGSGWSETVASLVAATAPERVTIWSYEWFCANPAEAFGLLSPGTEVNVHEKELRRVVMPSLTSKGLQVLRAARKGLSKDEYIRLSKMLRRFEFDEPNPRLGITDPALIAAFDAKYQADLARIRAMGVQLCC